MIVADTNTIAYLLIVGEHTTQARRVIRKNPEFPGRPDNYTLIESYPNNFSGTKSVSRTSTIEIASDGQVT